MQRCSILLYPLSFLLILFAPMVHGEELTIVHTGGLSRIFDSGAQGANLPTEAEVQRTLKQLRAENPDALALDSGGFLGASSLSETQFMFQASQALHAVEADAVNINGRDMLYARFDFEYDKKAEPALGLPVVSSASYSETKKPAEKIDLTRQGRTVRIVGVGDFESLAKNLMETPKKTSSQDALARAEETLKDGADGKRLNVVLSDRLPEENDRLAQTIPAPALILEQMFDLPEGIDVPPATRQVGGAWIVSKDKWWTADRIQVTLRDDQIVQCKVKSYPYNRAFNPGREGGFFSRLLGGNSRGEAWSRHWAAEKPNLGMHLGQYNEIRRLSMDIDDVEEYTIENPPGADSRKNQDVYFYRLHRKGQTVMDYMRAHQKILPGAVAVDLRFGVSLDGKLVYVKGIASSQINQRLTGVSYRIAQALEGKTLDEAIAQEYDPAEYRGLEFEVLPTIEAMRELLTIYRDHRDEAKVTVDPDQLPIDGGPIQFNAP